MRPRPELSRGRTLALVALVAACRGRSTPAVDWQPRAGTPAESAALLVLGEDGRSRIVCVPGRKQARAPLGGLELQRYLDVAWKAGPLIAGHAAAADRGGATTDDVLVVIAPDGKSRRLDRGVHTARFSSDGGALAYELVPAPGGATDPAAPTSYVLELDTGKLTDLAGLSEPRWEPDGKHLRATRMTDAGGNGRAAPARPRSLRVRWDRESGATTADGPGGAQVPAPVGDGVAWSENRGDASPTRPCAVRLSRQGGIPHVVVGEFCAGSADDRALRWSPDGKWLAFPHPGVVPGQRQPGGFFVDVVGIEGGRYPALSTLHDHVRPEHLAIAPRPDTTWFDWSATGRYLAAQDGVGHLRVYDFEAHGVAELGQGRRPLWSPGGAYLAMLDERPESPARDGSPGAHDATHHALILTGSGAAARLDLGPARDARWLPPVACASD